MGISVRRYAQLLTTYLQPQWRQALLLLMLLLGSLGLELINPQLLRAFIDTARSDGALSVLTQIALLFLVVALGTQLVNVAEAYVAENVGLSATNQMRGDLALHCLQLDPAFHNAHTPGELIERIDGDVATLGNFFSRFVVQMLGNTLLLVGVLVLLWSIDWRIGFALTLFVMLSLAAITSLRNIAVPAWTAAREGSARLFGFLEERLAGTEDVRSSGATAYTLHRLDEHAFNLLRQQRWAGVLSTATGSSTLILLTCGTAAALGLAAYLFANNTITLGTVFLIFTYAELLRRPIEQITRQMQDLQQASASLERVQQLFAVQSAVSDTGSDNLPASALTVEFDRVSFSYDDHATATTRDDGSAEHMEQAGAAQIAANQTVLHEIILNIPAGTRLGVLGRSGSGKTTLTRLLFRLYDPQHGTIRLNGTDLRSVPLRELRKHIGMVTQDIQLFHASVRDNLTLFDPSVPDENIVQVLGELGLLEWLESLPDGLSSKLAPGGSGLSAGEAQLLAFARVFLHDPGLVILDEASSRLDPATEQRLEHAIDRLLQGRTGIIIAHRIQTVQRADAIVIMEQGGVLEYGPREQLARDQTSRFAHLLRTGLEDALA